jgi:hypothetical protein
MAIQAGFFFFFFSSHFCDIEILASIEFCYLLRLLWQGQFVGIFEI